MTGHEAIRARLEERLRQLSLRADRIEADLRRPQDRDWEERAIETENDEVLEKLDSTTLEEVREIRNALSRIDKGTYGVCSVCGGGIAPERLQAVPYATTCINCAS